MNARVLISGYYGFGNLGDEALLDVIVSRLRQHFPSVAIEVLSATPQRTASAHGVEATPRWDWRCVRASIRRADVVLSGGGGLLQNATSLRSLLYYTAVIREAVRARRRVMIFAQSIGPLDRWGRLLVSRFCRGVARATVRDARSALLLHQLLAPTSVEQTADPVFLYDLPQSGVNLSEEGLGPESGPYAVVSVRKSAGARETPAVVARAVDRLAQHHGVRAAFLPLGGASDAAVSTDVIRACNSAPVLLPECPPAKAAAILAGARVAIGMRLHALIFAARFAVPFLAIPYDPKVTALCDDLGYPLQPLWTPGAARPSDEEIDRLVDRLIAQRDSLSSLLSERAAHVRAAAERNFDVLGELLSEE